MLLLAGCGGGGNKPSTSDTTPPTISLNGSNPVSIQQGESYIDAGASAINNGQSVEVSTHNPVNTSLIGTYMVTYTASDLSGNVATRTRAVRVIAPTPSACSDFEKEVDAGPLAALTECGLQYRRHAVIGETEIIHTLPDFSYAGYQGGGVAIPDIPSKIMLSPLPNEDDTQQIQSAINQLSQVAPDENGFRGAIVLSSGEYDISSPIEIKTSGIVLRGAGQNTLSSGGTVLRAKTSIKDEFIVFKGQDDHDADNHSRVRITNAYIPIGAKQIEVSDASGFSVGDLIGVRRTPNNQWLSTIGMDNITDGLFNESWTTSSYAITHIRTIESISGNTLTINIPMVDSIQQTFGGGDVAKVNTNERLHSCGIEDIRLISDYASEEDESHSWDAILLENVENCWVRRVSAMHFAFSAVTIVNGSFNTVEEVAIAEMKSTTNGGRRYAFGVNGNSVGNLFQRCYASEGRHNFISGSRVTGPNVWLDCLAENSLNDDGPHHRWATGLLFDNIETLQLNVQNRYNSGSGHGWAGAQVAIWNPHITSVAVNTAKPKPAEIIVNAPPSAISWAVGVTGDGVLSPGIVDNQAQGIIESWGQPVSPRSLYIEQLRERLGEDALDNVILPAQKQGNIWDSLRAWKGNGALADYM